MDLIYKHEKSLSRIAIIISTIFWIALVVGTIGIALIYFLLGYLFFLFAHSVFISYLKGTGVKISPEQYPDLHERIVRCCEKVDLKEVPEAYILRTDFFNAMATRFRGRHFMVLFSDVVDALEDQPGALDFYIGHEVGHIHRKHLSWNVFTMPASIFPLLGAALRRAEEYTCDRYGAACCTSEDDIKSAIAAMAAGDTRWKTINIDAYLGQIQTTNGFWMSFNELTADYPWLTKRMASAIAASRGEEIHHPRRHMFAWFLSIFVPRFGAGGAASMLVTVAIIGILAAVAIPAYQQYINKAQYIGAYSEAQALQAKVADYASENQSWPASFKDLGYENETLSSSKGNYEISIYNSGTIGVNVGVDKQGEEQYIVLEPEVTEGVINWNCYGQNLTEKLLPPPCQ